MIPVVITIGILSAASGKGFNPIEKRRAVDTIGCGALCGNYLEMTVDTDVAIFMLSPLNHFLLVPF